MYESKIATGIPNTTKISNFGVEMIRRVKQTMNGESFFANWIYYVKSMIIFILTGIC